MQLLKRRKTPTHTLKIMSKKLLNFGKNCRESFFKRKNMNTMYRVAGVCRVLGPLFIFVFAYDFIIFLR